MVAPSLPLLEIVDAVPRSWASAAFDAIEGGRLAPAQQQRCRRQPGVVRFSDRCSRGNSWCALEPKLDELEPLDAVLEVMRWRAFLPDKALPRKASATPACAQQQEGGSLPWTCQALSNLRR